VSDDAGRGGLFVAGTDTGVGKTVVTAAIVARLRHGGVDAVGVKPLQTGADDDAGVVRETCASLGVGGPDASRCFDRLDPALAPRVAAETAGETVDVDAIRGECETTIRERSAAVVEGVGGLRVPISDDVEVLDLAESLDLPSVIVARSGLGTLNHTCLTVDALQDRGLCVSGVLLNNYRGETAAERTNPDELRRTLDVPVATLPEIEAADPVSVARGLQEELPPWVLP
jgi:dethiobiotin synthetase